jgi:serine/threonine-protein kinase/endoribonuclease IRE1
VSPDNIFFIKRDVEYIVKLTNFSKAEKMSSGFNYYQGNLLLDIEFSAPELIRKIFYSSSDIWSLGKVFIYIMLQMGHGKFHNGKSKKGVISSLDRNQLKNDSNDVILCKHMLENILVIDPEMRMTAENILVHPFFWSAQKTRDFILDIAKMLEGNNDFRSEIFKGSQKVIGGKGFEWASRISNKLLDELKNARKAYCSRTGANNDEIDGKKITSLIHTMRNMIVHTKSAEVIAIVGDDDETFIKYWTSRFPNLILHLYQSKIKYENKENF